MTNLLSHRIKNIILTDKNNKRNYHFKIINNKSKKIYIIVNLFILVIHINLTYLCEDM